MWQSYVRKGIVEMRPYVQGEILLPKVSISVGDIEKGSPKEGDMIARNPQNHNDMWLVAKDFFEKHYERRAE